MKQRFSCTVCETPPKSAPWGAFLFPYCEQGLTLRLVAICSLVKPSAKVVADYPCRDGEKEGNSDLIHTLHAPPSRAGMKWQRIKYSILHRKEEAYGSA